MILEHIKDFDGAHESDLLELFDRSLTEHQLAALLKELKDDSKIYFDGKRRSHTGVWRVKE